MTGVAGTQGHGGVAGLVDAVRAGEVDLAALGESMHARMAELYPVPRSLTGDGVRATLDLLDAVAPLERHSVPTGYQAYDWTVTDEWSLRRATITDADGRVVVDTDDHSLHVVGYSTPVRATLSLEELRGHLHTLPDHPDWIPYRTSYYHRRWGFCLPHRLLERMEAGEFTAPYDVVVDADLGPGELTWGELVVPGETDEEVMVTAHLCHPSIANDNLSGLVLATELARTLAGLGRRRWTYRFLFAPGTVGSVVWLAQNVEGRERIRHGLVLTGLGGPGPLVHKRSRRGDREVDRAVGHVVARRGGEQRDYSPWGYDERQFNALGFDLPFARLSRTPHNEYPEYHTSADDLSYVRPAELADAFAALLEVVDVLENDATPRNLQPHGEPQLGKRGLYPTTGGQAANEAVMAMLWVLAYADGATSLVDIATRADVDFAAVRHAADRLSRTDLLA